MDESGFAALHHAVKAGSPGAIQVLIDNGADKEIRSSQFLTPVLLAVVEGKINCLEKLLENEVDLMVESSKVDQEVNDEDYGIFALCVVYDQPRCLEVLMSLDEDEWRSVEKHENTVHGKERGTIMGLAVKLNRMECLKILLKKHCSPGEDSNELNHAFCKAADQGNSECLHLLFEYNLHQNVVLHDSYSVVEQRTLLFAALRDNEKMLHTLVEKGFRVRLRDEMMNALHAAAVQGNFSCLKFILEHTNLNDGEGIRVKDGYGKTALYYAVLRGHPKCIEILIEAGAWPSTFKDGLRIITCSIQHKHYCVPCQGKQTCVCYGTMYHCQINKTEHNIECKYREYYDTDSEDICTGMCNCDMGNTIEMLCRHAMLLYVNDDESGQDRKSEVLMNALNACLRTDQPETLKWVLNEGITFPPNAETYFLYSAVEGRSERCLKILLDYGRSFLPEKSPLGWSNMEAYLGFSSILFWAIFMDIKGSGFLVKPLFDVGFDLNERGTENIDVFEYCPAILYAINTRPIGVAKVMISLGVSANLSLDENIQLEPPSEYMDLDEQLDKMLEKAALLLTAGFDREKVLGNFRANIPWRRDETPVVRLLNEEHQDKINKFVLDMTRNRSLQELCRDAIGKHLMSVHPNTNLFLLMPQLVIPGHQKWMKDFLLCGVRL